VTFAFKGKLPGGACLSIIGTEGLARVVTEWRGRLGTESFFTSTELIDRAQGFGEFNTALLEVAGAKGGKLVSPERLGRWLRSIEGKIVAGTKICRAGVVDGYSRWWVRPAMS
jgi:hypothetical protein